MARVISEEPACWFSLPSTVRILSLLIALVARAAAVSDSVLELMPAYTREGRKVQDHIEGLRQYLGVAERDDLARIKAPEMTPIEFARMLPYALALDVEKTWADRFAAVLGRVSRRCGGRRRTMQEIPVRGERIRLMVSPIHLARSTAR